MQALSIQNVFRGVRQLVAFVAALPLILPGIFHCSCCNAIDVLPCVSSTDQATGCCSQVLPETESCCVASEQQPSERSERPEDESDASQCCTLEDASSCCSSKSGTAELGETADLGAKRCKCCKEASSRSLLATLAQDTFVAFLPEPNSAALAALPGTSKASSRGVSICSASGKQICVEQCRWLN